MPGAIPVTTPVLDATLAIAISLLLHVPPAVALDNVVVSNGQTESTPVMAEGAALTITVVVAGDAVLLHDNMSVTTSV